MIHNSTVSGITEFRPNVGNAIYFADAIGQNYVSGFERGENNYEVFLNIRNPHTESYEPAFIDEEDGIDGVFMEGEVPEGVGRAAIVKKPNQIKSATENNGEFSKENNDISFSVRRNSGYTERKNGQAISRRASQAGGRSRLLYAYYLLLIHLLDVCARIVVRENLAVGEPFFSHHCSSDLAHAHSVSPTFSMKAELLRNAIFYVEGFYTECTAL